jgi:phage gpG-like protein
MAKVKFTFDPFEIAKISRKDVPKEKRELVMQQVADYVVAAIKDDCSASKSPVTGRDFKKLKPKYAASKTAQGASGVADLSLSGDLLESLEVERGDRKLTLTVPSDEQGKADGHNNFSGKSKLPKRKFIPNAENEETFRPGIREGIAAIIEAAADEDSEG